MLIVGFCKDYYSSTNFYDSIRVKELCQTMYQLPHQSKNAKDDDDDVIVISSDEEEEDNDDTKRSTNKVDSVDSLLDDLEALDINRETPSSSKLQAKFDHEVRQDRMTFDIH